MKKLINPFIYILVLISGCATAELSIENTRWYLVEIEGDSSISILNDKEPFLELDMNSSKVGGNASCNNFFGDYILDGTSLSFGMIATTMMACQDEGNQEHRFIQALSRIDSYEIRNNELYLLENGKYILKFESR
ncbi:MAG: META domain-containing protein [Spirochaetales bacterium]|nr:META domain-containing protein [Spirochaetales bacterium]